jgi:hypothetical protein
MKVSSKIRLVRLVGSVAVVLSMAAYSFAAVGYSHVGHGPSFPPDPWDGKVAHGPSFPPDPWDGKVSHGPSFPPDPWDGRV